MADLWHHEEPNLGPSATLRADEDEALFLTVEGFNGDGTTPLPKDAAWQLYEALRAWLDPDEEDFGRDP